MTAVLVDPERLTPSQELVLEVLAARYRTGENIWTFGTRHKRTVEALASLGYVWWKAGIVYGTVLVGLTEAAKPVVMAADYVPPKDRAEDGW